MTKGTVASVRSLAPQVSTTCSCCVRSEGRVGGRAAHRVRLFCCRRATRQIIAVCWRAVAQYDHRVATPAVPGSCTVGLAHALTHHHLARDHSQSFVLPTATLHNCPCCHAGRRGEGGVKVDRRSLASPYSRGSSLRVRTQVFQRIAVESVDMADQTRFEYFAKEVWLLPCDRISMPRLSPAPS